MRSKWQAGDRVIIARRHPQHGLCGFNDVPKIRFEQTILGKGAELVARAVTEYGEEAWIVRMRHPISGRIIQPTLIASMFDKYP